MLTPLEVENKKFAKSIRGYDIDDVEDFLDQVTVDYERLYKENAEYKGQIEQLNKELEHYKTVERTLQNTLLMAQSTAEDIKNMAQKQADQILDQAKIEAKKMVDEVNKDEVAILRRTEELKKQFDVYKAKMEALLISQLDLLRDNDVDSIEE